MLIYIHIPFCNSICSYCDFCKVYYNKKYIYDYLDNLKKEISSRYKGEKVNTIFIGGGTPSSLDIDELRYLFDIIGVFDKDIYCEFTMECNIDSISEEKLIIMKKYGINYDDINILKGDIDCFLELDIPHISTYSLIIEDNTVLKINGTKNIDEDLDYEMYNYIQDTLEKNGYIHYEISNYARSGYQSKHNLGYWNNYEYYGFGLSSVSYIGNKRISNTKNLSKYLSGSYLDYIQEEDKDIQMENEVMLGLRKFDGINLDEFKEKFNVLLEDVYDIDDLVRDGYLIKENNYLKINKKYMYISNEVIVRMFK